MSLDSEQVRLLLKLIQHTHEVELTCPECLDELDRYAQSVLDGRPIDGLLVRVREHLEACSACNDEYDLILDTLKAIEGA